ncbi:helix-hairpin-helix domain-containing protein [Xanthomonas arboricola pv. pruni]|uniref:Helix-hairpin-helix domain-containing protein n=1 Tax=Xanthomonas arboricola pv. pruni TaxID=69929 RepID=A0AAP4NII5_9XANT|nr:helix-hairpin-helix domain-containing protein [Xanthomonas arboricola]MDN0264928.1 helix-hairpin-helix domain-containing protein [Xanthomonas arboricola pv. pruni]MDN0268660.1 helix-hairpin-helix domain-containing protein [Xanthomonas arboricola pv. pruni]MDN0272777.1 helix-hairpin-helix domain-containing protein [Xanthomonas arboricola pv. pruni]MDN0281059.1 helix-hairpin-helix domain-containing protein [Xanthomonas arboricola pv. pruni]MDN0285461.1 helix-hairpin-helix domain-containing pr
MWRGTLLPPAGMLARTITQATRSVAMKSFTVALKSLLLALLLSSNAYALDKVDINTASAEELDKVLTNVGRSKAEAIVEHRQANGPFKSAEELALVKGIGLKTVERNRDLIEVGATMAPAKKAAKGAAVKPVGRR